MPTKFPALADILPQDLGLLPSWSIIGTAEFDRPARRLELDPRHDGPHRAIWMIGRLRNWREPYMPWCSTGLENERGIG